MFSALTATKRLIFDELLGQIPPRISGAGDPEDPIQNEAAVGRFAPFRGADSQLESRRPGNVDRFCQHGLSRGAAITGFGNGGLGPFGLIGTKGGNLNKGLLDPLS